MAFFLLSLLSLTPSFPNLQKCNRFLSTTMERIKLLRSRRESQLQQLLIDVAKLLQLRKMEKAETLIGRICKELSLLLAYLKISEYCECVKINLGEISHKEICPPELQEPVAGLCFAASFCADLPELLEIREIFTSRFGRSYVTAAQELGPGCHVNRQFSRCLSVRDVPNHIKRELLDEIIDSYKLKNSNELRSWKQEEKKDEDGVNDDIKEIQVVEDAHEYQSGTLLTTNSRDFGSLSDVSPSSSPPRRPPPLPPQCCIKNAQTLSVPPSRAPPTPIFALSMARTLYMKISDERAEVHAAVPAASSEQVQYNENYIGSHIHPNLPTYEEIVANFTAMKNHSRSQRLRHSSAR
ncbi:hypothetical protein KP509_18G067000 [Ceratopteris richardii]|uniref:IST1-like protein n=1 Tax=Ceratopteris richardii TaxID=49495 RepID=A0A8T2SU83_CERRI|nr:hypothetical protein KP509_18G067000 [Ceratopteris richardii]